MILQWISNNIALASYYLCCNILTLSSIYNLAKIPKGYSNSSIKISSKPIYICKRYNALNTIAITGLYIMKLIYVLVHTYI